MQVTFAALTDRGLVRENNEDCFLVLDLATGVRLIPPPPSGEGTGRVDGGGLLLAVADGMGGALAGEVAARMAVESLAEAMRGLPKEATEDEVRVRGVDAFRTANASIHEASRQNPQQRGMGTTLTVAFLRAGRVQFFQVGDSKGFLARGGSMQQMTKDHSLIGRLVDDKVITAEDAERLEGGRNIILQALGAEPTVRVDTSASAVGEGDSVLLCSDGLHGCIRRGEIEERLASSTDPGMLCEELVEEAKRRGGPDNITVVAARVLEGGSERPAPGILDRIGAFLRKKT